MKNLNVCFRGKTFWKQENLFGNDKALRAERLGNDMYIRKHAAEADNRHKCIDKNIGNQGADP